MAVKQLSRTSRKLFLKFLAVEDVGSYVYDDQGHVVYHEDETPMIVTRKEWTGPYQTRFKYTDYIPGVGSKGGEWLPPTTGALHLCRNGYHAIRIRDIHNWGEFTANVLSGGGEFWLCEMPNASEDRKVRDYKVISHDIRIVRKVEIKGGNKQRGDLQAAAWDAHDAEREAKRVTRRDHTRRFVGKERREEAKRAKQRLLDAFEAFFDLKASEVYY